MTDPASSPKANPESLVLRGKPRKIARFKRNFMIGPAAIGFIGIVACAWVGLGKPQPKPTADQANLLTSDQAANTKKAVPSGVQALQASSARSSVDGVAAA